MRRTRPIMASSRRPTPGSGPDKAASVKPGSPEEATRREAEQRRMDIIEFLPDATFVIDQNKRIIAWNRACEIMTGVNKESLLGQGDYAYAVPFFGERRPILIDLLDLPSPEIEARYKYVERRGETIYAESFVPRLRNGQGAHLWGSASPLFDPEGRRSGAIEVVRDMTAQKLAEQALRESERKYRELVEHANSIILRWTRDGRITFLNEFGQRFFGYTEEEIHGRHVVGHDRSRNRERRPRSEAADGRDLRGPGGVRAERQREHAPQRRACLDRLDQQGRAGRAGPGGGDPEHRPTSRRASGPRKSCGRLKVGLERASPNAPPSWPWPRTAPKRPTGSSPPSSPPCPTSCARRSTRSSASPASCCRAWPGR